MKTFYMIWNPGGNEFFGTDDPEDADYARSGVEGNNGVSSCAEAFREAYCDDPEVDELRMTTIQLESPGDAR